MSSILFLITWASLPAIWVGLMLLARVSLDKVTMPSVLIWFVLVFQYMGLPLLYFGLDPYRADDIPDSGRVLDTFLVTAATTTLLIIGYLASRVILHTDFTTSKLSRHHRTPIPGGRRDVAVGLVLSALGLLVLLTYVDSIGVHNLAISSLWSDGSDAMQTNLLRSQMGNAFQGRYYLYKLGMRDALQIGSYTLFAAAVVRPTSIRIAAFALSSVACAASLTLATEKLPIFDYLVGFVLLGLMARSRSRLTRRVFVGSAMIGMCVFTNVYFGFVHTPDYLEAVRQGLSRILTGQIEPLYHYLAIFPDQQPFLLGRSMPNPAQLLPFEHYQLPVEVMNLVHPWHVHAGVVGTMPTFFCGELWANFGPAGIFLIPPMVGFAICWFADFLDRFLPTPFTLASITWIVLHIKNLSNTSLSNYMVDAYLVSSVAALLCFHHFGHRQPPSRSHRSTPSIPGGAAASPSGGSAGHADAKVVGAVKTSQKW